MSSLNIPTKSGFFEVPVEPGRPIFLLGANGSGKSGLLVHLYKNASSPNKKKINAYRHILFKSNTVDMTPAGRKQYASQIDRHAELENSRWKGDNVEQIPNISLYDLIDAENQRARKIAGAVDLDDIESARDFASVLSPVAAINDLMCSSNLTISLTIEKGSEVCAKRGDSAPFSISLLSDGERSALLLAAEVLVADNDSTIFVDEPERHLHRSIISPMLNELLRRRSDCCFVISTHDTFLPVDCASSVVVMLRECNISGGRILSWDADIIEDGVDLDEDIKEEILGSRRTILFVEGVNHSLDLPIYRTLFPHVSIIAKSTYSDVERAVIGVRSSESLHWIKAFGLVDGDFRSTIEVNRLKGDGIYSLERYSVESIYYEPWIQSKVAERKCKAVGGDANIMCEAARDAALSAIAPHVDRLASRLVEHQARSFVLNQVPNHKTLLAQSSINIEFDVSGTILDLKQRIQNAIRDRDLGSLINRFPLRETPALDKIASELQFTSRKHYELAVQKLLVDDVDACNILREQFRDLSTALGVGGGGDGKNQVRHVSQ